MSILLRYLEAGCQLPAPSQRPCYPRDKRLRPVSVQIRGAGPPMAHTNSDPGSSDLKWRNIFNIQTCCSISPLSSADSRDVGKTAGRDCNVCYYHQGRPDEGLSVCVTWGRAPSSSSAPGSRLINN